MAKRNREENSLGDVLKDFIKANRLEKGLDRVSAKEAWFKVMGNGVSNYTTEVKLDRETLYVALSSSVLREELGYGKQKIITMMNEEMGKEAIKKIVLR